MLTALINTKKRKQLPDEQSISYINKVESLCRRIDNKISDTGRIEIVRSIMKGLKPDILRSKRIFGNETLDELKITVRKYKFIDFMTTRSINKSPFEIESEIIQNKTQQINTNDFIKNNEINKLRHKIETYSRAIY